MQLTFHGFLAVHSIRRPSWAGLPTKPSSRLNYLETEKSFKITERNGIGSAVTKQSNHTNA